MITDCVNCRKNLGLTTLVCLTEINGEKFAMVKGEDFQSFEEMYVRVLPEDKRNSWLEKYLAKVSAALLGSFSVAPAVHMQVRQMGKTSLMGHILSEGPISFPSQIPPEDPVIEILKKRENARPMNFSFLQIDD